MGSKEYNKNYNKFSVAMSVYKNDKQDQLDRALESIICNQTVVPNEVVLVIDGPINEFLDNVINKYSNIYPALNIVRLNENAGLGNALKIALENSKYDLIARMDADDIAVPERFEEQLKCFDENPDIDIVGGDISEFIGDEANIVAKRRVPVENSEIRNQMKTRCAMNHVTVMFRKKAVESAGGYQDWFWNEDYYLWIRMWLNDAVFRNTGTVLVNVRVGEEMYKRRGGKKYFSSEKGLQDFMLNNKMITRSVYLKNIIKRIIVQVILPNNIRGWVFKNFARD